MANTKNVSLFYVFSSASLLLSQNNNTALQKRQYKSGAFGWLSNSFNCFQLILIIHMSGTLRHHTDIVQTPQIPHHTPRMHKRALEENAISEYHGLIFCQYIWYSYILRQPQTLHWQLRGILYMNKTTAPWAAASLLFIQFHLWQKVSSHSIVSANVMKFLDSWQFHLKIGVKVSSARVLSNALFSVLYCALSVVLLF